MRNILVVCLLLLSVVPISAKEIAGVNVAESLTGADGVTLTLNGAGIRSKLFFKIYLAQLYLENPGVDAAAVLADEGQKRMIMHFLYDEVGADKLVEAWNDGFASNLSKEQLASLGLKIEQFNSMFTTVKDGDVIVLDYLPGKGTRVEIAGVEKGMIEGKAFSDALFAIWLGEKPVTADLKKQLLSYTTK